MKNKILFDDIHTKKKQEKLQEMMIEVSKEVHSVENPNKKLEKCLVCNSLNINHFVQKFGFDLSRCNDCSAIICDPMPSKEQIDIYYNSEMKEFENEFFEDSFEKRIPIFNFRIKKIKEYKKSGTLLDIGSAIGIFIEALKRDKNNFEIECCDPSVDACKRLNQKYSEIRVHNEWLENLKPDKRYDIITFWDTLEHIIDPSEFFKNIKKLIKKDGYLLFSTPNTKSFEWLIAGKEHVQLLPPGHVILYDTDNIKTLLDNNGFELIDISTPNASLDISYIEKFQDNKEVLDSFNSFLIKNNKDQMTDFLVENKMAGNMVCIAKIK